MRLLITTFNSPDVNLDEALLFKASALSSSLLSVDRMDELWNQLPPVLEDSAQAAGIARVTRLQSKLFAPLSLALSQGAGWRRLIHDARSELTTWLASLYSQPVNCWVIGGHHHFQLSRYQPMCWGTDFHTQTEYRPYTGFGVSKDSKNLEWFGYRTGGDMVSLPLAGARAQLQNVSLLLVLGCNGVPVLESDGVWKWPMARYWRQWLRTAGSKPLILGWFNTQLMPLNAETNHHVSPDFWTRMRALKDKYALGADALQVLCRDHADEVVQAWGAACYGAFHLSKARKRLWGQTGYFGWQPPDKQYGRGCGAVAPDGTIYHANPQYSGADTGAMLEVGTLT